MRLECPNCHAAFEVPDERLRTVRKLRCSRCGSGWQNSHRVADELAVDAVEPECAADQAAPTTSRAVQEMSGRASERRGGHGSGYAVAAGVRATPGTYGRGGQLGWLAGWSVSVAGVGAAGFAMWHWREFVARTLSGIVH